MVGNSVELYTDPASMEPLFPDDPSGGLAELATELIGKANRLSATVNPITRSAIAEFLRPMNSYYSNLIEGHDTHPIDIYKALNNNYSKDRNKRNKQIEAHAHIKVHQDISGAFNDKEPIVPSTTEFLTKTHQAFYRFLPDDFRVVKTKQGKTRKVNPGALRTTEVEVGSHVAPYSKNLAQFLKRFEAFYNPQARANQSKVKRVISIAASHHRLTWIHPFIDGNGRVVRLYSDACFMYEQLAASGLWSISRGLARTNEQYMDNLANADAKRQDNYDGRGNLSNKALVAFCRYFLQVAVDQLEYMYRVTDPVEMIGRIERFSAILEARGKLRPEAKYILIDTFLKGKISKTEAMRITGTSDKTLKKITDSLVKMNLLTSKMEGIHMMYFPKYPIHYSPVLFPGLYPADKEPDMMDFPG